MKNVYFVLEIGDLKKGKNLSFGDSEWVIGYYQVKH